MVFVESYLDFCGCVVDECDAMSCSDTILICKICKERITRENFSTHRHNYYVYVPRPLEEFVEELMRK